MRIAVPIVKSGDKILLVPHFGRAPSFAIVDLEGNGAYYRLRELGIKIYYVTRARANRNLPSRKSRRSHRTQRRRP
jgi:predicted Fe-Mo cluster-binding NifX family protein